jgi:mRNA interferase MazF
MDPPRRSEVWLADLGFAAKVRPVLVVSVPYGDSDYALVQVVPHTTRPREGQFEARVPVRFLEPGAFNLQGTLAIPVGKFLRRLGALSPSQMEVVEAALKRWLGLAS